MYIQTKTNKPPGNVGNNSIPDGALCIPSLQNNVIEQIKCLTT